MKSQRRDQALVCTRKNCTVRPRPKPGMCIFPISHLASICWQVFCHIIWTYSVIGLRSTELTISFAQSHGNATKKGDGLRVSSPGSFSHYYCSHTAHDPPLFAPFMSMWPTLNWWQFCLSFALGITRIICCPLPLILSFLFRWWPPGSKWSSSWGQ